MLTPALERTLERALVLANERRHEYATVEHLLLALTDDADAAPVLRACRVDLGKLRADLHGHLDQALANLVRGDGTDAKPTAGFQRVLQRAAIHVQSVGGAEVNGANLLIALFSEKESHALYFLQEQDMSRSDAINYLSHGIAKPSADVPTVPARFDAAESALQKARDEQRLGRYGSAAAQAHAALLIAMDMTCEARGLVHGSPNAERAFAALRGAGLLPESVDGMLVALDASLTAAQAAPEHFVADGETSALLLQTTAAALRFLAALRREAEG